MRPLSINQDGHAEQPATPLEIVQACNAHDVPYLGEGLIQAGATRAELQDRMDGVVQIRRMVDIAAKFNPGMAADDRAHLLISNDMSTDATRQCLLEEIVAAQSPDIVNARATGAPADGGLQRLARQTYEQRSAAQHTQKGK